MDKLKALAAYFAAVLAGIMIGAIGLDAAVTTHLTSGHIWVGSSLNVQADVPCSGDVTCANTGAITIGNAKVSYAKLQNEGATSLLGNPTGSPAAPSEITLGSGLNFSGTTLVATGSGGTITSITCNAGLTGGTITTTGTCTLDVTNANSWTGIQTFGDGKLVLSGSGSGSSTLKAPATGGGTATLPAGSGTIAYVGGSGVGTVTSITCNGGLTGGAITTTGTCALDINNANTWTAVQTFTNSDVRLLGSSTGYTTFTSDNAGASNFTLHFPAANDTLAVVGTAQSFTKPQRVKGGNVAISTATFTFDLNAQQDFEITLVNGSCPCTIANPSNISAAASDHQHGVIIVNQSSSGSDTIGTWGSQWVSAGGTSTLSAITTAANAQDIFSYDVIDSTHILIAPAAANVSH